MSLKCLSSWMLPTKFIYKTPFILHHSRNHRTIEISCLTRSDNTFYKNRGYQELISFRQTMTSKNTRNSKRRYFQRMESTQCHWSQFWRYDSLQFQYYFNPLISGSEKWLNLLYFHLWNLWAHTVWDYDEVCLSKKIIPIHPWFITALLGISGTS